MWIPITKKAIDMSMKYLSPHDVRVHGIKFSREISGYPSMELDVDIWKMLEKEGENYVFSVQPAILKYTKVRDVCLNMKHHGDPFFVIFDCVVEKVADGDVVKILLNNGDCDISFFAESDELSPYGVEFKKVGAQYLESHERPSA